MSGSANLKTLIEAIPPYWAPMRAQAHTRIGNPTTEAEFLWSRSPLSRVDDIRIPVLIAQGANDPRVPQTESEQIVTALRERDIPHQYLLYPDEGHSLTKPDNRIRFYTTAEQFLAEHLGDRAEHLNHEAAPQAQTTIAAKAKQPNNETNAPQPPSATPSR